MWGCVCDREGAIGAHAPLPTLSPTLGTLVLCVCEGHGCKIGGCLVLGEVLGARLAASHQLPLRSGSGYPSAGAPRRGLMGGGACGRF